jgi:NAD(P)-dependent dehydrogenase (short-subunit alcohol dehydrogenase family)
MEIAGKHVVVTGAAGGIGSALAARFVEEGARAVVASDLDEAKLTPIAEGIGAQPIAADVGREDNVKRLIDEATAANGPIDIFVSNAGVPGLNGGAEVPDDVWDLSWRVNVMAHVWACRQLVPQMTERGEGYLVNTASAAGLLTQVSAAPYSATKAAAVSLAEWLAIEHGDAGIRVSCICPQGIQTAMLDFALTEPAGAFALQQGGVLQPEDVAQALVDGIREERFLILPHDEVRKHMAHKAGDTDRWINGMRRLVREARANA